VFFEKKCPCERREQSPTLEFKLGMLCRFINGTICRVAVQKNWREKISVCKECEVFTSLDFDEEEE
jgi:hypothetical protein